jgi:hypothetical protein
LAQGPSPPDPSTLAHVDGHVTNSVTGEPLRKTEVRLHGTTGEYVATSDGSGQFTIDLVPPGSYNLTAQHQNFSMLSYGATRPGLPGTRLTLTAGQKLSGLAIKLTPFGVISGKVVDQEGDPVTGVPISVMQWGFSRGGRQLVPSGGGASTNDRGEFRVYNLPAGKYFLIARPVRMDIYTPATAPGGKIVVQREPVRESYSMTFYPASPDVTAAAPIALGAGQEAGGKDIQLRKTRVFTVQGRIAGFQPGNPSNRISLSLQPVEATSTASFGASFGMGKSSSLRQDDGTFTFRGVDPGRYTLIAMTNNKVTGRQEVSVGDTDLMGLIVTLMEPGSVKGRILFDTSGASRTPALKGLRVSLAPVDAVPMNVPNANTADDGSFTLDEVPADRFKVNCSPLDGSYLKTIRWNGQVSSDGTVEMAGGGSGMLELEFAATSAQIDGDVKTGDDPAPGASVLLVPASRRDYDFRFLMADQNGHFVAKAMAPGGYTVLAVDSAIYGMPDPALLKALEKFSTFATVEQGGQATVSLKLIPQGEIEAAQ